MPQFAGIILAAGASERQGSHKALLPIDEETFLARINATARAAGLDPIVIVVGEHAAEIKKALPDLADQCVENPDPDRGPLSSLHIAMDRLPSDVDGFVKFLVDHPLATQETIEALLRAHDSTGRAIVVPEYEGQRGHPVLYARDAFEELRGAPLHVGAKHVTRQPHVEVLPVTDSGVVADIDTREDFERHIGQR